VVISPSGKPRLRSSFVGGGEYDNNIQIADLNVLKAVLAVIEWKKFYGFYADDEHELFATYTIVANQLLNADQP